MPNVALEPSLASLKSGVRHRCLAGHPWVYASELAAAPGVPPGAEVTVVDLKGRCVGRGTWNPHSQIAVRLFARRPDAHLDAALIRDRILAARERRRGLINLEEPHRVLFSEGDQLPGVIVDLYEGVLVVQILTLAMDQRRDLLLAALIEAYHPRAVLERSDAPSRKHEGLAPKIGDLMGTVPEILETSTDGVRFLVKPRAGQKTGAFLDQSANHRRFASFVRDGVAGHGATASDSGAASGCAVLDAFAYHGLFGLHAARAGATAVTMIESSAEACAAIGENAKLNNVSVEIIEENAFDALRRLEAERRKFQLISLDPPTFTRSAGSVEGAQRGYREINLRALRLLTPGGLLFTSSCSFHTSREDFLSAIGGAAHDSGRDVTLVEMRGASPDHPVRPEVPETDYLKCAVLRVV